jgi:hypothetical protein
VHFLYRNVFAASLAWITLACNVEAKINIVDWFLNLPIYPPVARMGLCTHVIVQMMLIGTQKQPGYFSNATSFHNFFRDFLMTLAVCNVSVD